MMSQSKKHDYHQFPIPRLGIEARTENKKSAVMLGD